MSPDTPPVSSRTSHVEIDIDGDRYPGTVRSWDRLPDGTWSCLVTVQMGPGQVRTERFAPEQLAESGHLPRQ